MLILFFFKKVECSRFLFQNQYHALMGQRHVVRLLPLFVLILWFDRYSYGGFVFLIGHNHYGLEHAISLHFSSALINYKVCM